MGKKRNHLNVNIGNIKGGKSMKRFEIVKRLIAFIIIAALIGGYADGMDTMAFASETISANDTESITAEDTEEAEDTDDIEEDEDTADDLMITAGAASAENASEDSDEQDDMETLNADQNEVVSNTASVGETGADPVSENAPTQNTVSANTESTDKEKQEIITGKLIGSPDRGYALMSDGREAFCIDEHAAHIDDDAEFIREDDVDASDFEKFFAGIARADEKGYDKTRTRKIAQLAIWQGMEPSAEFDQQTHFFFGQDGSNLFNELLNGSAEGYTYRFYKYIPQNKNRYNDTYQPFLACEVTKIEEKKPEETTKAEETKVEEIKVEENKQEETKQEEKEEETDEEEEEKTEETEPEETKTEETKVEETKAEETKVEETKQEETKVEEIKVEENKQEETKAEETKEEETKAEETKAEETKEEETKVEETKTEEPHEICTHPYPRQAIVIREATCCSRQHKKIVCNVCGEVVIEDWEDVTSNYDRNNHTHFTETITKQPTYKADGVKTFRCDGCGYSYTEVIPKLECKHNNTGIYYKADGSRWLKCEDCGEWLEQLGLPVITCTHSGCKLNEVVLQKATATQEGIIEYVCEKCGKTIETKHVHPYQRYTVKFSDGHVQTVYGWFDNDYAQDVWCLTNEYRRSYGLNTLYYNTDLQESSNLRALEASVYFDHNRPEGGKWNTVNKKWTYGGENIASGQATPDRVMASWKNSVGHNRNLLYGRNSGQTSFKGMSVGCFHRFIFNDSYHPSVPTEIITWVQNFTF